NPLAAAIARAALRVIVEEGLIENAAQMGEYFLERLVEIPQRNIKEVRGKGLLIGVEMKHELGNVRRYCEALRERGILVKDTHEHVIRFAPPLIITREIIDWAMPHIQDVLTADI
ncbi:MAG: aminotransferase class III-fold pyridoxal phosphate-dependent enzyme, partial [Thermanaerothrix sp.]|nr:aminotransferase class III-fold pyridoxal phosphate-dependent enzyme [Thermanaerothrix sp.]